ncbi:MAG: flagellin lysine-N-methylase [Oscillospiraceae bacterium]
MNKIIKPSFYDTFACIADKCKANCCTGWRVDVSKNSYELVKKTKMSNEMQEKINKYYKRDKKNVNNAILGYAHIKLREDGACSFLDEQGLCSLQKECGYKVLPTLCQNYPRTCVSQDGKTYEFAIDNSCEAVVSLLLKQKDGIEYISGEMSIDNMNLDIRIGLLVPENFKKYYWDVRMLSIATLQSTQYSLDDRMLIMGLFLQKICEFDKNNETEKIPSYVDNMISLLEKDEFKGTFDDLNTHSFEFLQDTFAFLSKSTVASNAYAANRDIFIKIIENITSPKDDNSQVFQLDIEKYNKQKDLFEKYCEKNPRVIENVIVNNFQVNHFPFKTCNIWENYIEQCVYYNMTKLFCAALLDENLNDEAIIDGVRILSRTFSHTQEYIKMVKDCIEKSNDKLANMAFLIKN